MFSYIHGDSPNHLFKRIHFNIEIDELVDKEYLIMPKLVRGITKTDLSDVEINGDYISQEIKLWISRKNENQKKNLFYDEYKKLENSEFYHMLEK